MSRHYANFTMELKRARTDQGRWDYHWSEWSAIVMRAGPVATTEIAMETDDFHRAALTAWTG